MAHVEKYVNASTGDDADDGSSGTPWKTLQHALDNTTAGSEGSTIYLAETDTLGAELDLSTYGTANAGRAQPLIFRQWPGQTAGVINGAGSYNILYDTAQDGVWFIDLRLTNTGGNIPVGLDDGAGVLRCEIDTTSATCAVATYGAMVVSGCHIHGCTGGSNGIVYVGGYYSSIVGNYIDVGTTDAEGVYLSIATGTVIERNMIVCNHTGAYGIRNTTTYDAITIRHNSIYNQAAGTNAGIANDVSGGTDLIVVNNIVKGWSGAGGTGIEFADDSAPIHGYNYSYQNTSHYSWGGASGEDISYGDDEEGATDPFAGGVLSYANRYSYFLPADVGNCRNGGFPIGSNVSKGAVQYYQQPRLQRIQLYGD